MIAKSRYSDAPYSLSDKAVYTERLSMLRCPHIAPLSEFVDQLKRAFGRGGGMPYFDPLEGGVQAKRLIVQETPGPKAVGTNFISRNNPDPTAKNTNEALRIAELGREDTLLWNVVPWNVSSMQSNGNPRIEEVRRGICEESI